MEFVFYLEKISIYILIPSFGARRRSVYDLISVTLNLAMKTAVTVIFFTTGTFLSWYTDYTKQDHDNCLLLLHWLKISLKGLNTISSAVTLSNLFCLAFEEEVKGKHFPRRTNCFLFD